VSDRADLVCAFLRATAVPSSTSESAY